MLIVLANTKGGVGKSTLAVHLAVWLHDRGFKTALIDADRQKSSSVWVAEAEPAITVAVSDSPNGCLSEVRGLTTTHDVVVGVEPGIRLVRRNTVSTLESQLRETQIELQATVRDLDRC